MRRKAREGGGQRAGSAPSIAGWAVAAAAVLLAVALAPVALVRRATADGCGVAPTERLSIATNGAQGDADSLLPASSSDGCIVAFKSSATNLVAGDTNDKVDVFVRNRVSGVTERVTVAATGSQPNDNSFPPALSADGGIVAFGSLASNL